MFYLKKKIGVHFCYRCSNREVFRRSDDSHVVIKNEKLNKVDGVGYTAEHDQRLAAEKIVEFS